MGHWLRCVIILNRYQRIWTNSKNVSLILCFGFLGIHWSFESCSMPGRRRLGITIPVPSSGYLLCGTTRLPNFCCIVLHVYYMIQYWQVLCQDLSTFQSLHSLRCNILSGKLFETTWRAVDCLQLCSLLTTATRFIYGKDGGHQLKLRSRKTLLLEWRKHGLMLLDGVLCRQYLITAMVCYFLCILAFYLPIHCRILQVICCRINSYSKLAGKSLFCAQVTVPSVNRMAEMRYYQVTIFLGCLPSMLPYCRFRNYICTVATATLSDWHRALLNIITETHCTKTFFSIMFAEVERN